MFSKGDIVTITWARNKNNVPIGIVVEVKQGRDWNTYHIKWFDSPQQDGEYLEASLKRIDNDND